MQYELIRKTILKRLVLFLALSLLSLNAANMVLAAFTDSYTKGGRLEIRTKIAQDSYGMSSIYLNGVAVLRNDMLGSDIAFTAEKKGFLQNGNQMREAALVMTDSLYAGFSGLDIIKGSFFSQDACISGKNLAIISEATAKELYASRDIIGSDIIISGVRYRIAGVYREKKNLLTFLGNDGKNKVYIPLLSTGNGRNQPLDTIYIAGETIEKDAFRLHNLEVALSEKLGVFPSEMKISDYYGFQLTIEGIQAFCVFCIGLYILWVAFTGILKLVKSTYRLINKSRDSNYLLDAVRDCRYDILKAIGLMLLELGMAVAAFTAIKFTLYLPSSIIPQENIFDLGFYAQKMKEALIASNLSVYYYPTRLMTVGNAALATELVLLAVFVVSFMAALSQIKLLRLHDNYALGTIAAFAVAIAAALVLSLIFALVCGFAVTIAIKQSIVVIAAAILYSFRGSLLNNEAVNKSGRAGAEG